MHVYIAHTFVRRFAVFIAILSMLSIACLPAIAQSFKYAETDYDNSYSPHTFGTTLPKYYPSFIADECHNPNWFSNHKYKNHYLLLRAFINHDSGYYHGKYTYKFVVSFKARKYTCNSALVKYTDTLVLSYDSDSGAIFEDECVKKYDKVIGFDSFGVIAIYDVTNPAVAPVNITNPSLLAKNFTIRPTIHVQKIMSINSPAPAIALAASATISGDALVVSWPHPNQLSPASYELEWTHVDDYLPPGRETPFNLNELSYDFRNNSTRVWVDSTTYRIPLTYQSGYIIYRVRIARPDMMTYSYPEFSSWSISNDAGSMNTLPGNSYMKISSYKEDKTNWQYTVSFAENGKYKHVLSYFDGMLKNRQTLTRFNSVPNRVIATQNIYDYEGRPGIKILPTPVNASTLDYIKDLSWNSSNQPYKASDFDFFQTDSCNLGTPASLSSSAKANIYYSSSNPLQTGYHKYIPSAGNYPFIHTVVEPGNSGNIEIQGGAGANLQIGAGHATQNFYMGAEQTDIDRFMGVEGGWGDYHRKIVTKDPNGQVSSSVLDYKGRPVMSYLTGRGPGSYHHAIIPNNNIPDSSYFRRDLMLGATQNVYRNYKSYEKKFFAELPVNDSMEYRFRFKPMMLACGKKNFTLKANYHFYATDECGNTVQTWYDTVGFTAYRTTDTLDVLDTNKHGISVPFGKNVINKILYFDEDGINRVVDSFIATSQDGLCLMPEQWFINEQMRKKTFPCIAEPGINNSCDDLKRRMKEELYPGAKYGDYHIVVDTNNSKYLTGTNSIFTAVAYEGTTPIYRFQDTCANANPLPRPVERYGVVYTLVKNIPAHLLVHMFNDDIAEALLPLHPEYCKLRVCSAMAYNDQLMSYTNASQAGSKILLDSMVANDPLRKDYLGGAALPADSLKLLFGRHRIDTLAIANAYCACQDTTMYRKCVSDVFKNQLKNMVLTGKAKETYFKALRGMYIQNRQRFVRTWLDNDTVRYCGPCYYKKMSFVPPSVGRPMYTSTGAFNFADTNGFWKHLPKDTNSIKALEMILSIPNKGVPQLMAMADSIRRAQPNADSISCHAQVDGIIKSLHNCYNGAPSLQQAVKDTLNALCKRGEVINGEFTPEQITYVLTVNSISPSHICNPYIPRLATNTKYPAMKTICKPNLYYENVRDFLNDPIIEKVIRTGMPDGVIMNTSNMFEEDVLARVGASDGEIMFVNTDYDATADVYRLLLYLDDHNVATDGDTVKIYLRGGSLAGCDSFFRTTASNYEFTRVRCIRDLNPIYGADGYINDLSFVVDLERTDGGDNVKCTMMGWNNRVPMVLEGENVLAGGVPCTMIRELYTEFQGEMVAYGIKGLDHPYFKRMLTNFFNYRLKSHYTYEQYYRIIESCALADHTLFPVYGMGHAIAEFSNLSNANAFIANWITLSSTNVLDTPMLERNANGSVKVYLNFNELEDKAFAAYTSYYMANAGPSNIAKFNQLQSASEWPRYIGAVYVPAGADTTGLFALSDASGDFHIAIGATNVDLKIGSSDWRTYRRYVMLGTALVADQPHPRFVSRAIHQLRSYIDTAAPSFMFFNAYEHTVDADYYKGAKDSLLKYIYTAQGETMNDVLDMMNEDSLRIKLFPTKAPTYFNPANPGNNQHLYLSNHIGSNMTRLRTMMRYFAYTISGNPYNSIFPPTGPKGTYTNSNNNGPAYFNWHEASDKSFYYCYRGYITNINTQETSYYLYNVFVRPPEGYTREMLSKYKLTDTLNIVPMPSDDGKTVHFRIKLLYHNNSNDSLIVYGMTDFELGTNAVLKDVLLNDPAAIRPQQPDLFDNCEKYQINTSKFVGTYLYHQYIDSIRTSLRERLLEWGLNNVQEQLWMGYLDQRFQVTLNYYDRAGNLSRTVPPAGVAELSGNDLKSVSGLRANDHDSILVPAHAKESRYLYNSYNNITEQTTPDAGRVKYFYDAAGRLVFSQNEQQDSSGAFTYNLYDQLGRVYETGQLVTGCKNPWRLNDSANCYTRMPGEPAVAVPGIIYNAADHAYSELTDYVRGFATYDVVSTRYDTVVKKDMLLYYMPEQKNLRGRVSAIRYYAARNIAGADSVFDYAMYYSYDASGNVKALVHDYPALERYTQRYKRVDYDYDVVSGKVNMLSYNRGFPDQYYQRYYYDDDNRITGVQTSGDGIIWKNDAKYEYYHHGPLARMTLGQPTVQGVDYAYTIQGWLKAINSDVLKTTTDMREDGIGPAAARDAMALHLHYFAGDYTPIGSKAVHALDHSAAKNLYNGNIVQQTIGLAGLPGLVSSYRYDQLNRIADAVYDSIDLADMVRNPIRDYRSGYSYDPDGNLMKLTRYGNSGPNYRIGLLPRLMDSLVYGYNSGLARNNRLQRVKDYSSNKFGAHDIQFDTTGTMPKYMYDGNGNLIRDMTAGIERIKWNIYQKPVSIETDQHYTTLNYSYDGLGNRVQKSYTHYKDTSFVSESDYYVRDAQGNILAIYRGERFFKLSKPRIMDALGFAIRSNEGAEAYIDKLILPYYAPDGSFGTALVEKGATYQDWVDEKVNGAVLDTLLGNCAVLSNLLLNTGEYVAPLLGEQAELVSASWQQMFHHSDALNYNTGVLAWTEAMFGDPTMRQYLLEQMCTADPGGNLMALLETQYPLVESVDCMTDAAAIAGELGNMNSLATTLRQLYAADSPSMHAWLHTLASDEIVRSHGYYLDPNDGVLQPVLRHQLNLYGDKTALRTYFAGKDESYSWVKQTSGGDQLLSVVYNSDPRAYLVSYSNYGADTVIDASVASMPNVSSGQLVANAMAAFSSLGPTFEELKDDTRDQSELYYLGEHHLYGSSRIGVKRYEPGQYAQAVSYNTVNGVPIIDSGRLKYNVPWYSLELQDLVRRGVPDIYGGTTSYTDTTKLQYLTHTRGQKQYELTNHLGNVQAVLSDQRYADTNSRNFRPVLRAVYDYYPFGMLMPGRYLVDSADRCYTRTVVRGALRIMKPEPMAKPFMLNLGVPNAGYTAGGSTVSSGGGTGTTMELQVYPATELDPEHGELDFTLAADDPDAYIENTFIVTAGEEYTTSIDIELSSEPLVFTIGTYNDHNQFVALQRMLMPSSGTYTSKRVPLPNGTLTTRIEKERKNAPLTGGGRIKGQTTNEWAYGNPTYDYVNICNKSKDNYRFGFNGQEKDNELKGIGNSLNFDARMMDSRLGRFPTPDPAASEYPGISPYAFTANNPIIYSDLDGKRLVINNVNRSYTLIQLQKLTDDKLTVNPTTGVVTVARKATGKLKYPAGTQLVRDVINHQRLTTINWDAVRSGSGAISLNERDAENGKGSDVNLIFAKNNGSEQVYMNGKTVDQQKESHIVLGSELIHSLVNMDGYRTPDWRKGQNTYINIYGDNQTETEKANELQVHGIGSFSIPGNSKRGSYPTENTLRRERGKGERAAYEPSYYYWKKYQKSGQGYKK